MKIIDSVAWKLLFLNKILKCLKLNRILLYMNIIYTQLPVTQSKTPIKLLNKNTSDLIVVNILYQNMKI